MRSLFLKIFLAFWGAMAVFVTLAALTTILIVRFQTTDSAMETMTRTAVQTFQTGGPAAVHNYFHQIERDQLFRAILFDDQGHELSGRPVPRFLGPDGQYAPPPSHGPIPGPPSLGELSKRGFPRHTILAADGRHYTLILLPPSRAHLWFLTAPTRLIGILVGLCATGLICFFLARYVTKPIARLREASGRLAAGDLSARAGSEAIHRGDEIGSLVHDFDRMADRIENLITTQRRLLSDISHELRSPLARLNVAVGLARRQADPETQSALERIEIEADRLNDMLQNLLTLSRLESGEPVEMRTPVELSTLVADVVADADFEAQAFGRRVRLVASTPCTTEGNITLLRSAIENVVRNAARYTDEQTTVDVTLENGASQAVIKVQDQGPGVPEESLSKLFLPFYRVDATRDRNTGGVGLGLSIAERAVRLHGGSVTARNGKPHGLVVQLELPCVHEAPTEAKVEPAAVKTS
jgi:two-component system, OmpR family, sensor histidine kinase CpxA